MRPEASIAKGLPAGYKADTNKDRSTTNLASAQLNALFTAATDFAQDMLAKCGSFHPFGASMNPVGSVAMVAGYTGTERPPAETIIALLESAFGDQARCGSIQAAAICLDVRVIPPGVTERSDAICVRLASTAGESLDVFVPYSKRPSGAVDYGDVFATSGHFSLQQ